VKAGDKVFVGDYGALSVAQIEALTVRVAAKELVWNVVVVVAFDAAVGG
jgi:hypothetical protein